jgi:hypothetical protein
MGRRALRLRGAVEAAPVGRSGTSRHEPDDAWLSTLRSHGGLVPALPSPVLEPPGSRSPRCCQPPGSPPTRLPPPNPRPDHLRRAHPSAGVRRRLRRIADTSCSATPCAAAATNGSAPVAEQLRRAVLAAYDRLFGLELEHLVVDGCITKARAGRGPSPVDRRKRGLKRSMVTEAGGVPLATLPAQPITRRRAAGGDAGHHRRGRRATRTASGAPGRRLRLEALPTGSWPKAGWSARSPH